MGNGKKGIPYFPFRKFRTADVSRVPDKDGGFSWEKTDLAAAIKSAVK